MSLPLIENTQAVHADLYFAGPVTWIFGLERHSALSVDGLMEALTAECGYAREAGVLKKHYAGRCLCGRCTEGIAAEIRVLGESGFSVKADVSYAYFESSPRAECESELKHAWNAILADIKRAGAAFDYEKVPDEN